MKTVHTSCPWLRGGGAGQAGQGRAGPSVEGPGAAGAVCPCCEKAPLQAPGLQRPCRRGAPCEAPAEEGAGEGLCLGRAASRTVGCAPGEPGVEVHILGGGAPAWLPADTANQTQAPRLVRARSPGFCLGVWGECRHPSIRPSCACAFERALSCIGSSALARSHPTPCHRVCLDLPTCVPSGARSCIGSPAFGGSHPIARSKGLVACGTGRC